MQKSITSRLAQILNSIEPMLIELEQEATSAKPELEQIIANKCFTPNQDERIKAWFVKFLTLRESLWQVIDEAHEFAGIRIREIKTDNEYRLFVLGFVAACLVVKLDRLLLEKVAAHTFIQRKLNEGIPERNVQRKQYTAIYEAFTDVKNAYKIYQAINFVDNQQIKLNTFKNDRDIGNFVKQLNQYRSYLDENKRNYLKRFIQFVKHIFKRRGASVKQQAQFKLLEVSGRILSECVNKENKLVTNEILEQVQKLVKPGVAGLLQQWLRGSKRIRNRYAEMLPMENGKINDKVQEYYSIRCLPQILGPIIDCLKTSQKRWFRSSTPSMTTQ